MKKTILTTLLTFTVIFLSGILNVGYTQERSSISDSIYSDILKEQRTIKVLLPESYKPGSSEKYEVIYLTDGEWAESPFSFIYNFAKGENYVPPAIIVAIPNRYINGANQRDRDFLPAYVPQPAISGGADKFLSFLKNELIPYVNKTYPANGTNSLYGHSYGGVFVMYALLTQPELFGTYYATDPPYSWNNDYIIRLASEKLKSLPPNKLLWIAGIESTFKSQGIGRLDSVLRKEAPEHLHWKMVTFPNEKHNSVRLKAIYDGIKFSNSGYSNTPFVFHPMNGILLKDKATTLYLNGTPEIKYSLDGTKPDKTLPKAESKISVTAPALVTVTSFSVSGKYDQTVKGNFELGETLPSVPKPKKAVPGGLKYSYFEGEWDKLPDFKNLKPVKTGVADSVFNLNQLPRKIGFACLFEGYFEVKEDGYYIFGIVSNDGARLFINDKLIIDNDGIFSEESAKTFILPLEKGFYPIRLEYFQKDGNMNLQLLYLAPGKEDASTIPFESQYYLMKQ
jgi:predicted alpha/beta superfamily hydrolase